MTLEESAVKMRSYQNEGKGKMFPELMVVCQVCSKSGHIALQFYNRFDITYMEVLVE